MKILSFFYGKFTIVVVFVCLCVNVSEAQNVLTHKFNFDQINQLLVPHAKFFPYPPKNQRNVWDSIDVEVRTYYLEKATAIKGFDWKSLAATSMLEFVRTGNRTNYEKLSFDKRKALVVFSMAELIENKGRFIDDIVDGVWSICEESYWGLPSHLKHSKAGEGLVDVEEPFVDLFAAETARILALINYFHKAEFNKISPQIALRISREIKQRVLVPALEQNLFWMNVPNNWNTWISASWLTAVLLEETNADLRARSVFKIMKGLDNFLRRYPDDGGCDEGPAYWMAAGGSLYECLHMIQKATDGRVSYWQNPKIVNIGEYITKVRLTENYITNFADAPAQSKFPTSWVLFCGEMIANDDMIAYGAYGIRNDLNESNFYHLNRQIELVLNFKRVKNISPQKPYYKNTWLERIQVMVARDYENSDNGFVVVAKGGSNSESHNHNDVGSFMVYYNGFPVLIDVGNGTYTARTFSKNRYTLWSNASDYHNVPTINGINQFSARNTNAINVKYNENNQHVSYSAELQKAYPDSAGIVKFNRNILFERRNQIVLTDIIETKQKAKIIQNFMTTVEPIIDNKGNIYIQTGNQKVVLSYNAKQFKAIYEKMPLNLPEDLGIKERWGEVYRIRLVGKSRATNFESNIEIKPE